MNDLRRFYKRRPWRKLNKLKKSIPLDRPNFCISGYYDNRGKLDKMDYLWGDEWVNKN